MDRDPGLPTSPGPDTPGGPAAFLGADTNRIIVEVDVAENMSAPTILRSALGVLTDLTGKPVDYFEGTFAGKPSANHTLEALSDLELNTRDLDTMARDSGGAYLHVVVVEGHYANPLGVTSGLTPLGGNAIFLFPDGLEARWSEGAANASQRGWTRADLELVVIVHEIGHLLGLVGCGTPMLDPHGDNASACHSANPTSIMASGVARVGEWPSARRCWGPFAFDGDDLEDLGGPSQPACPQAPDLA